MPLEYISGTKSGLVRVLASDGFYTVQATSNSVFTIASHVPIVTISSPQNGTSFAVTNSILLFGNGYDAENGQLSDSALQWSSDKNDILGTGSSLIVPAKKLSQGTHTITLTATDKDGNKSSANIQIVVGKSDTSKPNNTSDVDAIVKNLQPWFVPCLGGLGLLGAVVMGASVTMLVRRNKKQKKTSNLKPRQYPKPPQPAVSTPTAIPDPSLQLQAALKLSQSGRYMESNDVLDKVIKSDPKNAAAWLHAGFNFTKSGRHCERGEMFPARQANGPTRERMRQ